MLANSLLFFFFPTPNKPSEEEERRASKAEAGKQKYCCLPSFSLSNRILDSFPAKTELNRIELFEPDSSVQSGED